MTNASPTTKMSEKGFFYLCSWSPVIVIVEMTDCSSVKSSVVRHSANLDLMNLPKPNQPHEFLSCIWILQNVAKFNTWHYSRVFPFFFNNRSFNATLWASFDKHCILSILVAFNKFLKISLVAYPCIFVLIIVALHHVSRYTLRRTRCGVFLCIATLLYRWLHRTPLWVAET